jgi:hypothetical protein
VQTFVSVAPMVWVIPEYAEILRAALEFWNKAQGKDRKKVLEQAVSDIQEARAKAVQVGKKLPKLPKDLAKVDSPPPS